LEPCGKRSASTPGQAGTPGTRARMLGGHPRRGRAGWCLQEEEEEEEALQSKGDRGHHAASPRSSPAPLPPVFPPFLPDASVAAEQPLPPFAIVPTAALTGRALTWRRPPWCKNRQLWSTAACLAAASTSWVFSPDSSIVSGEELDLAGPLPVQDPRAPTSPVPFGCERQDPSHQRGKHPQPPPRVPVQSTGRNWACRSTQPTLDTSTRVKHLLLPVPAPLRWRGRGRARASSPKPARTSQLNPPEAPRAAHPNPSSCWARAELPQPRRRRSHSPAALLWPLSPSSPWVWAPDPAGGIAGTPRPHRRGHWELTSASTRCNWFLLLLMAPPRGSSSADWISAD